MRLGVITLNQMCQYTGEPLILLYWRYQMPKKLTTEEFIKKSKKIHGDRYDYSLVEYKNTHTKVKIICNEHGEYIQKPYKHIYGQGCPYCVGKNKTTDQFIKECVGVHGDLYDYSLVDYTGMFSNIIVVCGTHGRFEQIAHNHVNGHGCGVCSGTIKKTTELFITDAQQIHGDKYDYSLVDYQTAKTKVKIICKSHGVYETTPNTHLNGRECPNCRTSKGERRIMDILNLCNISYSFRRLHSIFHFEFICKALIPWLALWAITFWFCLVNLYITPF